MSSFHLHIDAAILPAAFEGYARREYGFVDDDFEHQLRVEGEESPIRARHLTLILKGRGERERAKQIGMDLAELARISGLKGYIQCEFVMSEQSWQNLPIREVRADPGFRIHHRRIRPDWGERFKKHELHLEVAPVGLSPELLHALGATGLSMSMGERAVTFTASGHPNEIRIVRKNLVALLERVGGVRSARLYVEATVFFSLHSISP
ncbi:MAG: hypothetical protein ACXWP5_05690, partial [Bdellovibrionota bacterium]